MISDPTIIKNYPDTEFFLNCKRNGQLDFFYELHVGDATVIALIDTVKSFPTRYWFKFVLVSFADRRSESYTVDGSVYIGDVTKERFVELMIERYPDYFEWLLFHPEHLK